jgi:hypothetical protein
MSRTWNLDDQCPFRNKYPGMTIRQVLEADPGFLNWADDNVDWFSLDPAASELVIEAVQLQLDEQRTDMYGVDVYDFCD